MVDEKREEERVNAALAQPDPSRAHMQWLEPNARKEMESALSRFDDIDIVYAHNDPGAHGAYLAAKAAGREKDIQFVGIDALPHEGVMYVKQGIMDVTFQYPTGGAEAIDIALKIFKKGAETLCVTKQIVNAHVDDRYRVFEETKALELTQKCSEFFETENNVPEAELKVTESGQVTEALYCNVEIG